MPSPTWLNNLTFCIYWSHTLSLKEQSTPGVTKQEPDRFLQSLPGLTQQWGITPPGTITKYWDNIACTIQSACHQEMLQTTALLYWSTILYKSRQKPQSWHLDKSSSSPQVAGCLNKAYTPFQSKLSLKYWPLEPQQPILGFSNKKSWIIFVLLNYLAETKGCSNINFQLYSNNNSWFLFIR